MNLDAIFQLCTTVALAGWVVLLIAPIAPTLANRVAGLIIPALLAVAFAGLVLAFWSRAEGGFDSLSNVMLLFTKPEIACRKSRSRGGSTISPSISSLGHGKCAWRAQNASLSSSSSPVSCSPSSSDPQAI